MTAPTRIAVVGGGMAGLAAAWRLSQPEHQGRVEVTVYQRGWRLGGKAASSRGRHGRIEEHGLHVWLGYYDNAFRLVRDCYAALDRDRTDPGCPIRSWRDGFRPASDVGVADGAGSAGRWLARFPENDLVPGDRHPPLSPADLARRALELAVGFARSVTPDRPVRAALSARRQRPPIGLDTALADLAGPVATAGLAVALDTMRGTWAQAGLDRSLADPWSRTVLQAVDGLAAALRTAVDGDDASRRTATFVDLLLTMARGVVLDRLAADGWSSIDDLDFRQWLAGHGAAPETLDSPFVRGLYDLVFAYEHGDPARPRFPAGLGLHLAGRIFFDYKGAIFWKTRAGLGDVVVAPLYQALRRRGVRFAFFHRLDDVELGAGGDRVAAVSLGRQVVVRAGPHDYEPLVEVRGLPVFPSAPRPDLIDAGPELDAHDLEAHGCRWPDAAAVRLEAGRDFDAVVLAVSIGMIPLVCRQLVDSVPGWRAMVDGIGTVATRAAQLWLRPDEATLGAAAGATVAASPPPFETWASLSHQIEHEDWPAEDLPATAASFCGVLPDGPDRPAARVADAGAAAGVEQDLRAFLDDGLGRLWPGAVDGGGRFRPELLAGGGALDGQYWRANVDPSDRYVQALPGTDRFRLPADGSGVANLFLAGDWIDSGLNAGCIEAAVVSGLQAANAALGRPLTEDVSELGPRPVAHR